LRVRFRCDRHTSLGAIILLILMLGGIAPSRLDAQTIRIRMGTVAPRGSVWAEELEVIREKWREISNGRVDLRIYPSGVLGDEVEMLRKVRAGTLQGVALSQIGLSRVDPGAACLSIPFLFRSDAEQDYVRERLSTKLTEQVERQGFVLVNWGEAGWVRLFSKRRLRTPNDLRGMKLFTSAGDPESERMWKDLGFNVVPISLTDMSVALQTGMIDAFDVPPLFALLDRTFAQASYMLDLPIAPVVGGTLIERATWEQIPADLRPRLIEAAMEAGDRLRVEVRRLDQEAIAEMRQRGLEIVELDAAARELWIQEAVNAYPRLRGTYAPSALFDEAQRLVEEYRSRAKPR
jgi:TRAP-type C4-dicarboxylate transport system substrate-binding protein